MLDPLKIKSLVEGCFDVQVGINDSDRRRVENILSKHDWVIGQDYVAGILYLEVEGESEAAAKGRVEKLLQARGVFVIPVN